MKRIGLPLAAVLTTVGLTLSACGGYSEGDLAEDLSEDGGFTEEQADCIAKEVFDSDLSDDQIDALGSDADSLEDTDLSDEEAGEVIEVLGAASAECVTGG